MMRWWVSGGCAALIFLLSFLPRPEDKVVFLDVGQGDAILLQNGTAQVLIDGGPGMAVLSELARELPLFDKKIEVIVATHPDRDHLEGLLHVLERYDVGLVLLPQMPHTSQLQAAWLDRLVERLEQDEVAYRFAWAPEPRRVQGKQRLFAGDIAITILGPFRGEDGQIFAPGGKSNNASVLTRVDFGKLSLLLTADAEAAAERKLVAEARELLNVHVLKAGHHGSKTSTTAELLSAASPGAVVISAGRDNRYGHPHESVLARLRGRHVWRTDEHGAIQFRRLGSEWVLRTRSQQTARFLPEAR